MHIAYIMRGLPGSGKSTVARQIGENRLCEIHSTDNYFVENGEYRFDPSKLAQYHRANLAAFATACQEKIPIVICDNTNTQKWEFEPYVRVARKEGYIVVFVKLDHPSAFVCAERNTHGVPMDAIQRMIERWED